MAGLNHQACGVLDLASLRVAQIASPFGAFQSKLKIPTSVRKVTLMIATVRNMSLAERVHDKALKIGRASVYRALAE